MHTVQFDCVQVVKWKTEDRNGGPKAMWEHKIGFFLCSLAFCLNWGSVLFLFSFKCIVWLYILVLHQASCGLQFSLPAVHKSWLGWDLDLRCLSALLLPDLSLWVGGLSLSIFGCFPKLWLQSLDDSSLLSSKPRDRRKNLSLTDWPCEMLSKPVTLCAKSGPTPHSFPWLWERSNLVIFEAVKALGFMLSQGSKQIVFPPSTLLPKLGWDRAIQAYQEWGKATYHGKQICGLLQMTPHQVPIPRFSNPTASVTYDTPLTGPCCLLL